MKNFIPFLIALLFCLLGAVVAHSTAWWYQIIFTIWLVRELVKNEEASSNKVKYSVYGQMFLVGLLLVDCLHLFKIIP